MQPQFNRTVLMSGVDYFDDSAAINPFMDKTVPIDRTLATSEHTAIRRALEQAGVSVIQVVPPANCQDGVYTANWALVRGNKAIISRLPNARQEEEAYAADVLAGLGKEIYRVPHNLRFSGQGDALACGNYLFAGSGYRTDEAAHQFVADTLGYDVISLKTIPLLDEAGQPVVNTDSGWDDSFFYDIDLALSVLRQPSGQQKGLIAWCPEAFTPDSQTILNNFDGVEKIAVSLEDAKNAFACNLVSTGTTVIMSARAPRFTKALKDQDFTVVTPSISELAKGGGYIRCTTLTLDNN